MGKAKGKSSGGGDDYGGSKGGARRKGGAALVADDFAASDSDDDKKPVGKKAVAELNEYEDDSDMGQEVLGLETNSSSSDEGEDDGEDEDEDFDDDDDVDAMLEKEIARGGRGAELARQAKAIGAKLKLQQHAGDDGDDDDDEEKEAAAGAADGWGANKRRYYDADTAQLSGSDAEDAFAEEEEEVARLEKIKAAKMRAADFGLDDEADEDEDDDEDEEGDEDEDEEGGEATLGARSKGKAPSKQQQQQQQQRGGVEVEEVQKQLGSLSAEQRDAALLADAPELLVLLQDLTDSLAEVRGRVGPVLHEVRSGGLATSDGISYLEAKYLLLLQYCTHIVFYILLKAEGRPVKDHPVIGRLVELRAYMEKIRPIDKRLQYQVERLIKAAQIASKDGAAGTTDASANGTGGEDADLDGDALHFGPRRDQLAAKAGGPGPKAGSGAGDGSERGGGDGVYRPPKINPVSMDGDEETGRLSRNEARLLKEARRKASRSELVADLRADVSGAPREMRTEVPGFDGLAAVKQRQRLEARAAVEEDMMSRVPMSKEEAKKMKAQKRAGMSGKVMLDDFADEVADIVGMSQAAGTGSKGSRLADLFSRQKVSQKFGADAPRAETRGGDEDVPRRAPLHERRLKYDSAAARRSAAAGDGEEDGGAPDDLNFGGGARGAKRAGGEQNELYQAAAASAADRKRAKADRYGVADTLPPLADETVAGGARGITDAIERNRGLTPHRRKDLKNPRKKHRLAFAKAQVRRKGAVQDVKAPTTTYGGEATGVKSRVVKSRKLS